MNDPHDRQRRTQPDDTPAQRLARAREPKGDEMRVRADFGSDPLLDAVYNHFTGPELQEGDRVRIEGWLTHEGRTGVVVDPNVGFDTVFVLFDGDPSPRVSHWRENGYVPVRWSVCALRSSVVRAEVVNTPTETPAEVVNKPFPGDSTGPLP